MQKEDAPLHGSVWVLRDITQLRQAQATLTESEEKYRNLVERANDGIVIIQDSILRFVNQRAAVMLGAEVSAIVGSAFTEHIYPDWLDEVRERYERRMAGEPVPSTYESALRRLDGTQLAVELNAGVVTYLGRPADLVFIRDITERKRAEDEVRAHAERLERLNLTLDDERRKLLDLTEQLTVVNEELKRVSEAKSEFVAAASHDLRTPLTTIIEGIRMTEEGSLGPVNAEQQEFLRMAREDALRLRDLIGTLLDVAKIERGRMQASKTRVDARDIADRITKTYGSYAHDKGLHLATDLPPGSLYVYADPGHFHRILSNLVNNAVKFTPPGGSVTVRVQAARPGFVRTTVQDTGIGIPQAQQHRVFGRFEQIRRPSGDLQSGTGLGLALCRQLVELNEGTIEFESVEHEGSTFHFELPEYQGQAPTGEERRL
jgi:PAS domain S-box-containing protein